MGKKKSKRRAKAKKNANQGNQKLVQSKRRKVQRKRTEKSFSAPKSVDYPSIVPESLIRQAAAFTAPRGRLEMGGLLIGHVDQSGNNVAVAGLFPEQLKESPGYCEFDGMYTALVAAACDAANQIGDEKTPKVRVIGWIHTHPDIGIFLSGIDVRTFQSLRDATPDRRLMAVVVDPLREENGVFLTEKKPNSHSPASGEVEMSSDLESRYHLVLDKLEQIRQIRGLESMPCIIPGPLRYQRLLNGSRDDVGIEMERGFFSAKRQINELQDAMKTMEITCKGLRVEINSIRKLLEEWQAMWESIRRNQSEIKEFKKWTIDYKDYSFQQGKKMNTYEAILDRVRMQQSSTKDRLEKLEQKSTQDEEKNSKSRGILRRLVQILRREKSTV